MTGNSVRPWSGRFITTADVARMLQITRHGVRWMVRVGHLAAERTRSGQYLFSPRVVARLAERRALAQLDPARWGLRLVARVRDPIQLDLFAPRPVRLRMAKAELREADEAKEVLTSRVAKARQVLSKPA